MEMITVETIIEAPIAVVGNLWTNPEHVKHWNFASADWHCPKASSDFHAGGEFHYIMAAKDGSVDFDFCGTFTKILDHSFIEIFLGDGHELNIQIESEGDATRIIETFEPEEVNSFELQRQGWLSILNQFKFYAEGK